MGDSSEHEGRDRPGEREEPPGPRTAHEHRAEVEDALSAAASRFGGVVLIQNEEGEWVPLGPAPGEDAK